MTFKRVEEPKRKPQKDQNSDQMRLLCEVRNSHHTLAQVTVCVSLFNYETYIESCLDSVAEQTLPGTSLIVVDDASTDRGAERVMAWMETHQDRLASASLIQHASNLGLAAARNTAIGQSESEYVFILDADNEIRPRCLEALLTSARSSGAAFAYSIIEQFGDVQGLVGTDAWSAEELARGNYVDAMALLKRATWKAVGGYRKMTTPGWEDFDFWCRCVEADLHGILVPEILCRYRLHSRSMLRRFTDTLSQHVRVWDEIRSAHPWVEF